MLAIPIQELFSPVESPNHEFPYFPMDRIPWLPWSCGSHIRSKTNLQEKKWLKTNKFRDHLPSKHVRSLPQILCKPLLTLHFSPSSSPTSQKKTQENYTKAMSPSPVKSKSNSGASTKYAVIPPTMGISLINGPKRSISCPRLGESQTGGELLTYCHRWLYFNIDGWHM